MRLEMLKPQKNQIEENPGYCYDLVSLRRLRNQKKQLRNKQSVSRGSWENCYTGDTLASTIHTRFVTTVGLYHLLTETLACLHVWMCAHIVHRTAAQTTRRIFSFLRQQSSQVSQTQISTFLRVQLSMSNWKLLSACQTQWYMKVIASVCI